MPETISFTCAVCGKSVNDTDLRADTTLRRLIVNAQAFKAVTVAVPATAVAQTDVWTADGATSQWALTGALDANQPFTLTVNQVAVSVAVMAVGGTPTTRYVLVQQPSGVWNLQMGTDPVPAAGTALALSYTKDVPASTVASIEENNPGDPLIFCGQAHAAAWAQAWAW